MDSQQRAIYNRDSLRLRALQERDLEAVLYGPDPIPADTEEQEAWLGYETRAAVPIHSPSFPVPPVASQAPVEASAKGALLWALNKPADPIEAWIAKHGVTRRIKDGRKTVTRSGLSPLHPWRS